LKPETQAKKFRRPWLARQAHETYGPRPAIIQASRISASVFPCSEYDAQRRHNQDSPIVNARFALRVGVHAERLLDRIECANSGRWLVGGDPGLA
jgi:hypothetical protein